MMARCKLNPCCGATMPGKCEPPPQIKPNEGWEAYEQRAASLSPAATPVSEAEPVANGVKAWTVAQWGDGSSPKGHANVLCDADETVIVADIPVSAARVIVEAHNAELGDALAKPASSPAGGGVREAAKIIYEAYQSHRELPPAVKDVAARGGFFSALRLLIDPDADLRQPYNPLSQPTSAGRGE